MDINNDNTILQSQIIQKLIDEMTKENDTDEVYEAKKRIVKKFLSITIIVSRFISNFIPEILIESEDLIDEDIFIAGNIINNRFLYVNTKFFKIKVDLLKVIYKSIINKKSSIIKMMLKRSINLLSIEPRIMILCAEEEFDELLSDLIEYKIPIHIDNYQCIYHLASNGKFELLKKIMNTYEFQNLTYVVNIIVAQAIIYGYLNILEYFCPKEGFDGAPDIVFTFFIKSIECGSKLTIIKYFVENGISIKRDNYKAVYTAKKFKRKEMLKYFCKIDEHVIDLLSDEEKEYYGIFQLSFQNQYIGDDIICNISYNNISKNQRYFQCSSTLHHFGEKEWMEIVNFLSIWTCPICLSPVKKIIYINSPS